MTLSADQAFMVMKALFETVAEAGKEGAPSGSLYLACQHFNINLASYQALMDFMVSKGLMECRNHCYFIKEATI
jgi:hypothetical protein